MVHGLENPARLTTWLVIGTLCAWPLAGQAAEPEAETGADPATIVEEIRTRNPELTALSAQVSAADHAAPRAGTLPDPMFSVGLSNLPLSTKETPLTGVQFELKQTFPWAGKLAAREAMADSDAAMGRSLLRERRNAFTARARSMLRELRFLAEHKRLALEIRGVLAQFEQVAEATYTAGSGRQQDLIRPAVEQHRIDDLIIGLDRQARMLTSQINALRNRPPDAPIAPPPLDEAGALSDGPDLEALLERARIHNPGLRLRQEALAKQRAALTLAEKDYYPDVTVGLQYRVRWVETMDAVNGADFVGVGVGVNLPVWAGSKQGERVEEVHALIRAEEARGDGAWSAVQDGVYRLVEAIGRDRDQAALYRTRIIPDLEKALESSLADYRAGNLEFLSVLDNLTALFKARVEVARRVTNIHAARAELDHLLGAADGEEK